MTLANDTCKVNPLLNQHGWTITEMMIAISLGLFILLTATGLLVSSKMGYVMQDQNVSVQETGRYAVEVLSRSVRQAGYENWNSGTIPLLTGTDFSANVSGMDAMTLKKTTAGFDGATSADVVNGSDVLALRFFGEDTYGEGGAILNCAGLAVAEPTSFQMADQERGWSIFFVAKDSAGEPELRCKYQSKTSWNADAIARGVESFQVLYGIDIDGNGLAERFVSADKIDELDDQLLLVGNNAVARATDKNRKTAWKKIRAIKFSLLVRGSQVARDDVLQTEYNLFGVDYSKAHAATDKGVRIKEEALPSTSRNRIRKIFTHTIQLRNDPAGSGI
jgi:type IV pilus assembly protein PilW